MQDKIERDWFKPSKHEVIHYIFLYIFHIFLYFHIFFVITNRDFYCIDVSKANPKDAIPIRIIKENYDILGPKMFIDFNSSVAFGIFTINLFLKLRVGISKTIFAQSVFYLQYLKFSNDCYFTRSINIWMGNYPCISAGFGKASCLHKNVCFLRMRNCDQG